MNRAGFRRSNFRSLNRRTSNSRRAAPARFLSTVNFQLTITVTTVYLRRSPGVCYTQSSCAQAFFNQTIEELGAI